MAENNFEELTDQLGKKLQDKELEIDSLNSKLRKSEFEQKKLEAELESQQINSDKLAASREDLERQVSILNEQLIELRFENQRLGKLKENDEDPEISLEEVLVKYKELLQEKDKLEAEFNNFKEASIATILEKEHEIEEMGKSFSPEMLDALLKERDQMCLDNQELKARMLQMESELEQERQDHEEKARLLSQEQASLDKYREQMSENKAHETSLIEELRRSDEKIQRFEKNEKTLENELIQRRGEIEGLKAMLVAKEGAEGDGEEAGKAAVKLEKMLEETRKEARNKESLLQEAVQRLENESQDLSRRNEQLQQEKAKGLENVNALKVRIETLERDLEAQKHDFEAQIREKMEGVLQEKEELLHEMRELKEELNRHISLIPSAGNLANLKDDLELFNNYLGSDDRPMISMAVPSNNKLPSVSKLPSNPQIDRIDDLQLLKDENQALKAEIEQLNAQINKLKEEEIASWECELNQEKEKFRSYREDKDRGVEQLEGKCRLLDEKCNGLETALAEKNNDRELGGKYQALQIEFNSLEDKCRQLDEKAKALEKEKAEMKLKQGQKMQELEEKREKELFSLQEQYKQLLSKAEKAEGLSREKAQLEAAMLKTAEDFKKERQFLENEVKMHEEMTIKAKMMAAELSMERDKFQFKYQQALKQAKRLGFELK